MMVSRALRIIVIGISLGALAGCGRPDGLEIKTARGLQPVGSAFNQSLYAEYLALAEFEQTEMQHWISADRYSRKAKSAVADELVLPEEVSDYDLPPGMVGEIAAGRARLTHAFDRGGREARPNDAARAQAMLDCWLEQQEENIQPPHIARCREGFELALAQVEQSLPPEVVPTPVAMPEPAPPPPPEVQRSYIVFFDWDSSDLTPEALEVLRTAARNAGKIRLAVVRVTGHADRSGPDQYNMGLSMRRAAAVREEFYRQGIIKGGVSVYAKGETDPLVATPDGVREPQNRRVEIILR
jgi:OOP family OmpA-OmpF porin